MAWTYNQSNTSQPLGRANYYSNSVGARGEYNTRDKDVSNPQIFAREYLRPGLCQRAIKRREAQVIADRHAHTADAGIGKRY